MQFIKAAILIITVVLVISCTPAATKPVAPVTPSAPASGTPSQPTQPTVPSTSTTNLEFLDPSKLISVPAGVSFVITVSSNPTTGYSWEATYNKDLLELTKKYSPASSGIVGAGGVEHFEFKALKAGETDITMNYSRSFEPNNPPAETKKFKVSIK